MQKDTDWLDSQGDYFWNVCLVKAIDPHTGKTKPKHILLNYWFGPHSIQLRLEPTETAHNYDVYYKDKKLCKDIKYTDISAELEKYEVIIRNTGMGNTNLEIIKRRSRKCSKRNCTKSQC